MTYNEYKAKRDILLDEAQECIDKNDPEGANKKLKDVDALDNQWDELMQKIADEKALSDNQRAVNIEDYAVKVIDGRVTDSVYFGSTPSDLFLRKGTRMVDVIQKNPEAIALMNRPNALGDAIRGVVTGKWSDRQLQNSITTTTSGVLIPPVLAAGIVDLLRDKCLFTAAGVPIVPMEKGNITIARLASDPQLSFKQEGAEGAEGDLSFDSITLNAKTIYGFCYLSLESINSAENLDGIVKNAFAEAMARAIDKAMLYGQSDGEGGYDSFAPAGIWNDTNAESIQMGDYSLFDCLIKAKGKLAANNAEPSALAINSQVDELIALQKDQEERYLPMPQALTSLNKVVSNMLKYDASTGSDALLFDPDAIVIGMQENIRIEPVQDEKCLKRGLVAFRIYAMVDAAVVQPKAICKITGLK